MHHVAGSVAIGNDDAALFVEALPFHAIGSEAVYRIKREAAYGLTSEGSLPKSPFRYIFTRDDEGLS